MIILVVGRQRVKRNITALCEFSLEKVNLAEVTIFYVNQGYLSYKDNKKIYYCDTATYTKTQKRKEANKLLFPLRCFLSAFFNFVCLFAFLCFCLVMLLFF